MPLFSACLVMLDECRAGLAPRRLGLEDATSSHAKLDHHLGTHGPPFSGVDLASDTPEVNRSRSEFQPRSRI
jgi:hypothetical protein